MGSVAKDDAIAFQNIKKRLVDDVGRILSVIDGQFSPFWAVARMLFPIAEAIGDLIYRDDHSTVKNLEQVFQYEFEEVRAGYKNKANLITQLYRHSLTHIDELRELKDGDLICTWYLALDRSANHLFSEKLGEKIRINFDLLQFYDDIGCLLDRLIKKATENVYGGKVGERYKSWTKLNISQGRRYEVARIELSNLLGITKIKNDNTQ
ncbi:MAG TPA: hypothetical protein PLG93_01300 [bacterium]|nr:hypothetical protein [bacterium]HOR57279.1 hypothetical protein [bacterium]